jgi:non-heme chloroperoxidase
MTDTLTSRELQEIDAANTSGRRPVVFVHGLWLLASSWDRWRDLFQAAGFVTVAPGWPDDPDSVEQARAHPEVFAHKMVQQVTDHYAAAIGGLERKPAVIGHSFGGLMAQMLAGQGVSAATVAIDPSPFRGVLPVPASAVKASAAVLANPANRGRAIGLTFEQFNYGWTNNLSQEEARQVYETFHVAGSAVPIFQAVAANLNPWSELKVDTANPDRGPLLIISGEKDHQVPRALAKAAYKHQKHNRSVTEFVELPDRGHSLTIDSGWREVATTALEFLKAHSPQLEAV